MEALITTELEIITEKSVRDMLVKQKDIRVSKMSSGDKILFDMLVKNYTLYLKAYYELHAAGELTNKHDQIRAEFTAMKVCGDQVQRLTKQLGLDTVSKSKLNMVDIPEDKDPFD